MSCNVSFGHGRTYGFEVFTSTIGNEIQINTISDVVWRINKLLEDVEDEWYPQNDNWQPAHDAAMVLGHAQIRLTTTLGSIQKLQVVNATECTLGFCAKTYNTSVAAGLTSTRVIAEKWGQSFTGPCNQSDFVNNITSWQAQPSSVSESSCEGAPKDFRVWRVEGFAYSIARNLNGSSALATFWLPNENDPYNVVTAPHSNVTTPMMDKISKNQDFASMMPNVAASLTRYGLDTDKGNITGFELFDRINVTVRWPWLVLPFVLIVATILFLVVTVLHSHRLGVKLWKSSVLALLYHGLEEPLLEGKFSESVNEMNIVAKATNARLRKSADDRSHLGT